MKAALILNVSMPFSTVSELYHIHCRMTGNQPKPNNSNLEVNDLVPGIVLLQRKKKMKISVLC